MRVAVIHFNKITETTTLASARIARHIAAVTEGLLLDEYQPIHNGKFDVVFMVSSASGFASKEFRDQAGELMANAEVPIFCQNDYINTIPGQVGTAFKRIDRDKSVIRNWSSVSPWLRGPNDRYINWNMLNMTHCEERAWFLNRTDFAHWQTGLLYYGAFRKGRMKYFSKYLSSEHYPVIIGTTTRAQKSFDALCPPGPAGGAYVNSIRGTDMKTLLPYKMGLYLEDERCHKDFCSISCRFYEMLSAGVPMIFDKSCLKTFTHPNSHHVGEQLDITPYVVDGQRDVLRQLALWDVIQQRQHREWYRDWYTIVRLRFLDLWREVQS